MRNIAVITHLLAAIAGAAQATDDAARRHALKMHLGLVAELAAKTVDVEHDRERLRVRFDQALQAFSARKPAPIRNTARNGGIPNV